MTGDGEGRTNALRPPRSLREIQLSPAACAVSCGDVGGDDNAVTFQLFPEDERVKASAVDGATYPLRRSYDSENRQISLRTTRDNGATWDETTWTYDFCAGYAGIGFRQDVRVVSSLKDYAIDSSA